MEREATRNLEIDRSRWNDLHLREDLLEIIYLTSDLNATRLADGTKRKGGALDVLLLRIGLEVCRLTHYLEGLIGRLAEGELYRCSERETELAIDTHIEAFLLADGNLSKGRNQGHALLDERLLVHRVRRANGLQILKLVPHELTGFFGQFPEPICRFLGFHTPTIPFSCLPVLLELNPQELRWQLEESLREWGTNYGKASWV
jgi:hypothetical protein